MEKTIKNESEMALFAQGIASQCVAGDVVTLSGQLGVGKTSFARSFIHHLCDDNPVVVSPTFLLAQEYQGRKDNITHFDLYRIEHENDLYEIGLQEATENSICLIEWPEIAQHILPSKRIDIKISYGKSENERNITIDQYD